MAAAAGAGALPVFDTEFYSDTDAARIIRELEQESFAFGVRVSVSRKALIESIGANHPENLELLIFTYEDKVQLESFDFTPSQCRFFLEIMDIGLARDLERIAPNGLILKGFEAPGRVSRYTSFILMQWYLENTGYPLFIHGGVGLYTGAGLIAAGAAGFVLDSQLYLCDEAPLSHSFKTLAREINETDTAVVGEAQDTRFRFFAKLGTKVVRTLKDRESALAGNPEAVQLLLSDIEKEITPLDNKEANPLQSLFYLGQDACFARSFMANVTGGSRRVSDVVAAFFTTLGKSLSAVDGHDPMVANSPLALSHGTAYPVIQGPMANISDNPDFAKAVYENGGLPFFAMGNLPENLAETMIAKGCEKVGSFGAGLIGIETFNRTIHKHLEIVKRYKVPFALFAGGIPAQVNELEEAGIKTYLHTPNMMMLKNAIEGNCTRFIFEGTEAGGHVGSLTSLVLWESAMTVLMAQDRAALETQSVIFAGGISTSHASAFISGLSSVLAKKGAKIGVQVGTAYLFTREIVGLKSIGKLYQDTLTTSRHTIVTGNTVGLPSRTVPTPFARKLVEKEHRYIKDGMSLSDRKTAFEAENLGSLLISAKGFLPDIHGQRKGEMTYFTEEEQFEKGNFLAGDSLAFLDPGLTIESVHKRYFHEKDSLYKNLNRVEVYSSPAALVNDEIAVIGMGCVLPDAQDVETLWQNVVSGVYSIKDMPEDRLDSRYYYDTDKQAEDRTYTKIAGLVTSFTFDHERFGFTEAEASKMSRSQQMLLHASAQAAEDAGYMDGAAIRKNLSGRTAVIVASCLGNEKSNDLQLKYYYPELTVHLESLDAFSTLPEDQRNTILDALKQGVSYGDTGKDCFDSIALHMEAAAIARHLGAEGSAYVVDAACATSFAALDCAVNELLSGRHDTVIVAGINTNLSPEAFIGFGKMGALSAKGSWPFDNRADGFVLGEGTAVFVLKRLKDAVRQKNTIHAVVKGIGSSSDGKGKAIAAPNPAGQRLALTRCYEKIKTPVSVSDIGYIEAHGTSTIMGDQAEFETLKSVYKSVNPIGISSIKSQIGHLLGGAGAAGMLKAILALKNQTIPPNGLFRTLSGNIAPEDSPLYIITEPKPWTASPGTTRKAAVSSYGFGGINYHVVIEEYSQASPLLSRNIFADPAHDPNSLRVVIAGLGVVLPGAKNSEELSRKIPGEPVAEGSMPGDRFHMEKYASQTDPVFRLPEIKAAVVSDFKFNNVKYKIPPMAAKSVERAQLFALDAASQALENSGISARLDHGNKTGVVIGTMSGRQHAENILRVRTPYAAQVIRDIPGLDKKVLGEIADGLVASVRARYPKNTEDTVPGFLSNIVSGRIANFFGCNGANFIVDAANASSAVAMDIAAQSLTSGDLEFALTGGVDANLYPYLMFAAKADGVFDSENRPGAMGEGAALLVMTTLASARKHHLPVLGEYVGGSFSFNRLPERSENSLDFIENSGTSRRQARLSQPAAFDFGCMRSAGTAVNAAQALISRNEAAMNVTELVSSATGGLAGCQLIGSLHPVLSGKRRVPSKDRIETFSASAPSKERVVALLSGQGAQSAGMMKELYDAEPQVKSLMDRGEALFRKVRGHSLLDLMFGDDSRLNLTENTQPAVFLSTAAIYDVLKSLGFNPDYVIGHSVGEFTALYCCGLLNFDDAMGLVLERSILMKQAADAVPGKIMVVFEPADAAESLIRESGRNVYVANKNSDKQTAVSGPASEIESFCTFLTEKKRMFTKLSLSGAFHTPLFKPAAEKLAVTMDGLSFDTRNAPKIIANVNAEPYPEDPKSVKDLLVRQITSPVEFIRSVKRAYVPGNTRFVEIGPNRLLANLLKNMGLDGIKETASVNEKKGQLASFRSFMDELSTLAIIGKAEKTPAVSESSNKKERAESGFDEKEFDMNFNGTGEDDFSSYIRDNEESLKKMLYNEYMKHKHQQAFDAIEKFDFNPGKIVVSGVSVGLPGTGKDVFDPDNFTKLLSGTNFIEPLPPDSKEKMVDKNVTKLHKAPDGNAKFVEITNTDDVIQLAGQLGYFDLDKQYGIKKQYDITIALAMAAGIEALKDAHIPLVQQYKKTSTGSMIPDGYALPEEMQRGTGVILSALWPYSETLIEEMTRYFYNKFYVKPYEELEKIYYHLMESVTDKEVKEQVTEWFFKIRERRKIYGEYSLKRDFAHNVTPLGSAHFAQFIRAKGPNIQMSGACASATQALGIAEDWIRAGRCNRVILIGGETPTSEGQSQWIGSGFLSLGAASVKKNVAEAAKPFDAARNGTILGSGAVSMILEKEEQALRRGMRGQAEVLGTFLGNTAFQTYNIDVKGISREMKRFVGKIEKRHGLKKEEYSKKLVFMSHETFTPARGGSADAEITALRETYPDTYSDIVISNTKGYTGHTLGAALEDAALVKVLQTGTAPPIANLRDIEDNFKDLKLARETVKGDFEYGFHIAAGFGSHLAFAFFKRIEENTVEGNARYLSWLKAVTGSTAPQLKEFNNTLMAEAGGERITLGDSAKGLVTAEARPMGMTLEKPQSPAETEKPAKREPKTFDNRDVVDVSQPVATTAAPAQEPAVNLMDVVKTMIAEQTGYTVDMLEPGLDLEADLGIDTVKQVEIFGKISARFGLKVPENLKLKDLNTIEKLVGYLKPKVGAGLVMDSPMAKSVETPARSPKAETVSAAGLADPVKKVIAAQTGYDLDMLEDDLDLEADLGIDTVKQVEIFGKISAQYGLKVPENLKLKDLNTIRKLVAYMESKVDPALVRTMASPAKLEPSAAVQVPPAAASLAGEIKAVIATQTGYETDMLEDDLDLEADLGIDTVKQVEIFGKISGQYGLKVPENLKLKDLNTIRKLVAYMESKVDPALFSTMAAPAKPEPSAAVHIPPSAFSLAGEIKAVIAAQTGYETDMLEDGLDLEADLGIDTVKQVEIFGKISEKYGLKVPENLKLKDLNTIQKLVAYMETKVDPALFAKATAPVEAAVAAPAVQAAPASASLATEIKAVIAAQTGYETDMLEDDLDLEADLGIDTVKQVEIFGKISGKYGLKVPENLKLKDLNTIRKLVAYMETKVPAAAPAAVVRSSAPAAPAAEPALPFGSSGVKRYTVSVKKAETAGTKVNRFEKSCILVTLDSHGFADAVCREIRKRGGSVITMGKQGSADIKIDLCHPAGLAQSLPISGSLSAVTGLIHLAPLDHYLASSKTFDFFSKKTTLDDTVNLAVKSFFVLVKEMKNVLSKPGALISAVTFNSVVFPYMDSFRGSIHPAFSGMAGFLKTVNKEYPDTLVRLIDFAEDKPKTKIPELVKTWLDDLETDDLRVEKGYMDGTPYVLSMAEKAPATDKPLIRKGDKILVSGGALGITYEIIKKTAKAYNAEIVIMGRSRLAGLDPHYLLPTVDEKLILSRVKTEMKGAKPLDIKRAADRIMRTREAVLNIKRLEAEGIRVTYESADVTDAAAVEQVVRKHRDIAGVIHAAGVEESQFIEKKELASVDRVMDVKVKGLDNLLKALKDRPCRFLIAFSSVTARFGNEGQCDYTAANDMIGKMLMKERIERPERNVKVYAWTAWSGAGMAENETVKKVLESRGITFLPLAEGVEFFLRDLNDTADMEVVISGPDTVADTDGLLKVETRPMNLPPQDSIFGDAYPFLDMRLEGTGTYARFARTLSLDRDLFLFDHSMEGTPIFLGATGIETMAEAAHKLHGETAVVREIRDFSIPYGIKILKGRPKDIVIEAESTGPSIENACSCRISSVFTNPRGQVMGEPTLHYQGLFMMGHEYAAAERVTLPAFRKPRYTGEADSLIYHPQRLFMDDLFKTLKDVVSFDDGLMITEFSDTCVKPFFNGVTAPSFLTDVVAVDAMFQTGGLLEFFTTNNLVLPYKIRKMTVHRRVVKGETLFCLTRKTAEDAETCTFQLRLTDWAGNVLIRIDDFRMVKLAKLDEAYRITDRLMA
jgi:acyl transferase domain-containing protein/acyl carrier protein/NAD(P)H-dependent flavin oxidoreductase YrpB (nitropropane dioxygenase family)/NADP-dependent 3-hydroxy acid dehydrogenase YdfG